MAGIGTEIGGGLTPFIDYFVGDTVPVVMSIAASRS